MEAVEPTEAVREVKSMTARITRALELSARDVLIYHKRNGQPIVSWNDGRVIHVLPESIVIPLDDQSTVSK